MRIIPDRDITGSIIMTWKNSVKLKVWMKLICTGFTAPRMNRISWDALSVLGYDSLNEYLAAAGYVDEEGRPDADIWRNDSLEYASEIIEHGNAE